jgi:hypothetical protein
MPAQILAQIIKKIGILWNLWFQFTILQYNLKDKFYSLSEYE